MIVHLLEYKVLAGHAAEVAGFVRQAFAAPMPAGLLTRCVGRRLALDGPRQVVASAWQDPNAFRVGTNSAGVPRYLAGKSLLMRRRVSSQFRAVVWHGEDWTDARVLRLYRASVAVAALEEWEGRAPQALDEVARKTGSSAAMAGCALAGKDPVDGIPILVLTAWRDWDALLQATGGRLNWPLLNSELADFEEHALADHYELMDMGAAVASGPSDSNAAG